RGLTDSRSGTARRTYRRAWSARPRWRASRGRAVCDVRLDGLRRFLLGALERGLDERVEQRRGPLRARLELWVVLRRDEERMDMGAKFDRLAQPLVGRGPGEPQPGRLEPAAEMVVDLVAMAVALVHDRLAVELADASRVVQLDRVGAE